jgi:hypothetical protein
MASRKAQKERARQERLEAERAASEKASKRRRLQFGGGVGVAIVVGVIIAIVAATSGGSSNGSNSGGHASSPKVVTTSTKSLGKLRPVSSAGPLGPEGIPIPAGAPLASTATKASGQTVDGIQCNGGEQTLFHVHTHLTVFVNGSARQIPYGIGIPGAQLSQSAQGPFVGTGTCFYWLHTHAADGIVHIESPVHRTYTLGDFFDIWNQPLGTNQVGPAHGKVTAFFNGAHYTGNPRDIPLGRYNQIQLDVGTPLIAPEKISFAGTGL